MPTKPVFVSPSWVTLMVIWAILGSWVFQPSKGTMFTWDSFGYHLYLPATVIDHDPLLKDFDRVEQARKDHDASGTLYQISTLPDGRRIIKYPMGLAMVWSPWFMAGHLIAGATDQPQDGYSPPYDKAIRIGVWLYLLLGLLALRAVLRHRFSKWITAFTLLLLFTATNLIDQATMGMAMSHLPLFSLYAGVMWATLRWTASRDFKKALVLGVLMGLAMIIRPSEGLCLLLPFLWRGEEEVSSPFARAWQLRKQWAGIALVMFVIGLPQFIYWKAATGHWVLDTYNNPGEGFDFVNPHTWPFLFSFRKGWYIYTPLMLIATAGIFLLKKHWREAYLPILAFFLLNLYLLSSWTCWWYADSFGSRAMVGSYAVMALPLAAVLYWAFSGSLLRRAGMVVLLIALVLLNLFQYWQFKQGIIHSSRMTWAAYAAGFGRTEKPVNLEDLLLVRRSYSGDQGTPDTTLYVHRSMPEVSTQLPKADTVFLDTSTGITRSAYRLDKDHPFTPSIHIPFHELTASDHAWVEAEWQVLMPVADTKGSFVSTFEHSGGNYGYTTEELEKKEVPLGTWITIHTYYLTPEVRSKNDLFVSYFWLRDTVPLYVDGPKITIYRPKE